MSNNGLSYKKINAITSNFDRNFDNTVVDTFAFDKVLHSKLLSGFLYEKLIQHDSLSKQNLANIIDQSTSLVLHEVENIYSNTNHRVVNQKVYYDYIEQLINKIASVSEHTSSDLLHH